MSRRVEGVKQNNTDARCLEKVHFALWKLWKILGIKNGNSVGTLGQMQSDIG